LDRRHEVVEFFDPEHPNVSHGRCEPGEAAGYIHGRQDTGNGIDLFAAEINAPLLPCETVPLKNLSDLIIRIIVWIAIVVLQ